jgi:nucleoside-diphosphate-sugar epimerase
MRVFVTGANERSGGPVKTEDDPLDTHPIGSSARTQAAIKYVEQTVPSAAAEGIVLRYGNFYGPGASQVLLDMLRKRQLPVIGGGIGVWSFIEVADAAAATVAAIDQGAVRGCSNEKARKELGWEPRYASWREGFRAWVSG